MIEYFIQYLGGSSSGFYLVLLWFLILYSQKHIQWSQPHHTYTYATSREHVQKNHDCELFSCGWNIRLWNRGSSVCSLQTWKSWLPSLPRLTHQMKDFSQSIFQPWIQKCIITCSWKSSRILECSTLDLRRSQWGVYWRESFEMEHLSHRFYPTRKDAPNRHGDFTSPQLSLLATHQRRYEIILSLAQVWFFNIDTDYCMRYFWKLH